MADGQVRLLLISTSQTAQPPSLVDGIRWSAAYCIYNTNTANNNYYYYNYVYDYNYNESVNYVPLDELVPNAVVYGLTFLLGLVGNVLVIISVARYKRMQNVTNIFLLSLATADLLLVLICVPVKIAKFFSFTWTFGEVLCKLVHYLQNVSIICSVANLTGLSLERYYAILHPIRAKYTCTVTLARRTVLVIWLLSVLMALPILVGQTHLPVGERVKAFWCLERWDRVIYHQLYQLYMFIIILIMPISLMTFAYSSICRKLWKVSYHRATIRANRPRLSCQETGLLYTPTRFRQDKVLPGSLTVRRKRVSMDEDATRKQVIKMLVAVVVLFTICWGPIMMNNLLVAFHVLTDLNEGHLKPIRQAFWLMAYSNSCVNPIVYGFMSKNFRDTFRYTIGICCQRQFARRMSYFQQVHGTRSSILLPSAQSTSVRRASQFNDYERFVCSHHAKSNSISTEMTVLRRLDKSSPEGMCNGHAHGCP
ncbi:QRFP-like peptide receptor [Gigantopelta aegis]|uniref:QRFP-like peptide receptor n=1 Tax=Gigantopelta aegis TaxID=1735272 RepID=UPI001B88866D|nr:QRFP-like peptide receptor [Gigantopelta aegis]